MVFSERMGRNKWIVVTNNTLYQLIKRSGLTTVFISDQGHLLKDRTIQSKYMLNYEGAGILKELCCYYIEIPKGAGAVQLKKFLKGMFRRKLKRFRKTLRTQLTSSKYSNYPLVPKSNNSK